MRYAKSVIVTLFSRGLALPIGIASSIITARELGPEGRGVLALLIFFQGLTVQFGTVGHNASITYFMAREPQNEKKVVKNATFLAGVGGIVVAVLLWGASLLNPRAVLGNVSEVYLHIFLLSIPFSFLTQFLQNVLLVKDRIIEFNALDLLLRFTQMVAFGVFLIYLGFDTIAAAWVFTAVTVVFGIVYSRRVQRVVHSGLGFDFQMFLRMFRYGRRLYAANILMFLVYRVQLMLVNSTLGEREAGIYAVALQFADLVYLIPVSFGLILFPRISSDEENSRTLTPRVFRVTLWVMLVVCLTLALLGPWVIQVLYGDEFTGAIEPLVYLTPGIVAFSLVTILNNDLSGRGVPWVVLVAPGVALACVVPALLIALPKLGISGAAIVFSTSCFLMLGILMRHFLRSLSLPISSFLFLTKEDISFLRVF